MMGNNLRRSWGPVLVALCALVLFPGTGRAEYFTITGFHSDIAVAKDSSFTVQETIKVQFQSPRHGIFREIPYKYTDKFGRGMTTPLHVLSVTDGSGQDWTYKVAKVGNVINIKIGDAKKYVNGNQTYVISYRVENAILFLEDHDELYWNVTGNFWRTSISEVSARVALPQGSPAEHMSASCYTGGFGSRTSDCQVRKDSVASEFFSKRPLGSGEGLTLALGWEKGIVSPPSSTKELWWKLNLGENWVFLLPLLSLIGMTNLWLRRGRDPRVRSAVTVMYGPPKYNDVPLSPGEVGCLVDESLDPRDVTSSIIGLAVKGYLKIEEVKDEGFFFDSTDYNLSKTREPDRELGPFESKLMGSIFPDDSTSILVSSMKNKFYVKLDSLKETLYGDLVRKGYFLRNPEKVRQFYVVAGALVIILGSVAVVYLAESSGFKSVLACVLAGLPILVFSKAMPAKTNAGASAYMDILGFQEFLNRAEKDKIERLGEKDLFSKFLPYAIALDVAENWAKAFEGIYQDTPEWYVSSGGFTAQTPRIFSRSLGSMTSTLGSAMFSSPRGGSGGSSGGGSSGGGYGGGGGGSW